MDLVSHNGTHIEDSYYFFAVFSKSINIGVPSKIPISALMNPLLRPVKNTLGCDFGGPGMRPFGDTSKLASQIPRSIQIFFDYEKKTQKFFIVCS